MQFSITAYSDKEDENIEHLLIELDGVASITIQSGDVQRLGDKAEYTPWLSKSIFPDDVPADKSHIVKFFRAIADGYEASDDKGPVKKPDPPTDIPRLV